jgi:hypothetical protein
MKGWLDNFGKADNANDSNVSLPEGFVGLGYNTKGRNYSPAWGGQFEEGGEIAQRGKQIDKILNANKNLDWVQGLYDPNYGSVQIPGQEGRSTHFMESADRRVYPTVRNIDGQLKYLGDDAYNYADSTNSYIEFPTDRKAQKFAKNYKRGTGVLDFQDGGIIPIAQSGVTEYMKKKIQEEKDKGIAAQYNLPEVVVQGFRDPSPFDQAARMPQYDPVPTVPYLEKTKDPVEFFKSWITSPEYRRRKIETGYQEFPEYSPVTGDEILDPYSGGLIDREMRSNFLELEKLQRPGAITYDPTKRSEFFEGEGVANINPRDFDGDVNTVKAHEIAHAIDTYESDLSSKEINLLRSSIDPNWTKKLPKVLTPELWSKVQDAQHLEKPRELRSDLNALRFLMYDKDIYDIRKGKEFTKEDLDKAKKQLKNNESLDRTLMLTGDENFIKLMNIIAKGDEEITPIAMGGMSIPGSVGFTYARTAGSAPSKGKYAKKTMASAQIGKNIEKDETNIDTNIANKIAGLELQANPEYQYWKYLQSQPQLRQAPGRGEELMRKGLGYADVATDIMQLGNFIPHPTAQAVGKVGNIAGMIVDGLQGADEAYRGNYLNAGINLASVALPTLLGANTFRRSAMYLRPGDPLYQLTEQARRAANSPINLTKSTVDYIEPFTKVKKMTNNSLLWNRALLGALGAETAYDVMSQTSSPNVINSSDIEGVYPSGDVELVYPKLQPLPTKTESMSPAATAKKLADYINSKSGEKTGEVYGRKPYYPIDGFQNGGGIPSAQKGDDIERISINDPRYPEMYRNRQVGTYYDGAFTLPNLPEVTVTAPRSYTMDSLRDFTTAALYGAPATAMKLEQVPTAALAETVAMLTGKPYNFSNVNPNFGQFGSSQRDLSDVLGYENPEGFLQNAANIGLSAIDPTLIGGGSKLVGKQLGKQLGKNLTKDELITLYRIQEREGKTFAQLAEEGKIPKVFNNQETISRKNDQEKYFGQWFTKDKADLDWYGKDREFTNPEIIELQVPKSKLPEYQNYDKSLSRAPDREFVIPQEEQIKYKVSPSNAGKTNVLGEIVNRSITPIGYDPFTVLASPAELLTPNFLKFKPKTYATKNRFDAWRLYNGLEPNYDTFAKNADNTLAINDFRIGKEDLQSIVDNPKSSFGTMEVKPEFNFGGVHGNGWITKGVDEQGRKFIDFTDTWDLQPLQPIKGLPKKLKEFEVSSLTGGAPFDLKNRIYYDDAGNFFDHNNNKLIEKVESFPKGVVKENEAVDAVMLTTPKIADEKQMDVLKDWNNAQNQKFIKGAGVAGAGIIGGSSYMRKKAKEKEKSEESKNEVPKKQNGGEMKFYQNGLDWKPKSMQNGGEEDFIGKATKFVSEGISGPATTVALGLLNMIKPISNPEIYKTVRPVDYPNALKLPIHAYNYLMGNESEPLKTKSGKPHLAEEFWATAMGMPVERQYLKDSKYKPSVAKDPNAKYYTIRDVIDEYDLINLTKDLKPGEKMEMNGLSPILDTKWYSENANTDKNVKFADIDPLQRFTLEKSPDGSYVSIYDKYDFNNPALNKMMKPIEIYDRFYLPKKRKGGVIKDNRGQWAHPGEVTEIDSNYITMEGVPYDVVGVSDTGDTKLMKPGKNYKFKGKKVTEFPVAELGINQLDAQPMKKLNQLLNFTNNPDKDNWLDKYN